MTAKNYLIGADIGGSHITCMAVDKADHRILKDLLVRRAIDCHAGPEEILGGWTSALAELIDKAGRESLAGIGFAMPGPFDYPAGIALFKGVNKFERLYGISIRNELQKRLDLPATLPVRFINDASAFAMGEAWLGKAAPFGRSMAITLGTGFGSAFIRDGIPVVAGDDVPRDGCVWHIPYEQGIANDYFSTPWFVERYFQLTGRNVAGVKEMMEEQDMDEATGLFGEFGTNLGNFLAPWLLRFDAECLVIGGNISNNFSSFQKELLAGLAAEGCRIPVFVSGLRELAAIAGAARLCDDAFYCKLTI